MTPHPPSLARSSALDLLEFIDASPSPYHVVESAASRLENAGFVERIETEPWGSSIGRWFVRRGGSLTAWVRRSDDPTAPFRIVGAHTDSPNLRIKPAPDQTGAGFRQLGVEVYGGVLLNSWLDRDLGLSGRAVVRSDEGHRTVSFRIDRPILRVPQLAIHLDRELDSKGLKLNKQAHMAPVWGLESTSSDGFRSMLGEAIECAPADIVSWDAMMHDLTPGALVGQNEDMIASARLDNQLSCWAAIEALISAVDSSSEVTATICLFDHEEVGSVSHSGAGSSMLPTLTERIVIAAGGGREEWHRALAASMCVSADGAHATHPNYADRHEPNHLIRLNQGPVVKINANERYASSAPSHAAFIAACEYAGVPFQKFVSRTDLPCGSTIGPVTSARLGISTVDAGVAQLAMHSARETAGAEDPHMFRRALHAVLI